MDFIYIMPGTNDLKTRFNVNAQEITNAAGDLVEYTLRSGNGSKREAPKVLFIAPPIIKETSVFNYAYGDSVKKSL